MQSTACETQAPRSRRRAAYSPRHEGGYARDIAAPRSGRYRTPMEAGGSVILRVELMRLR